MNPELERMLNNVWEIEQARTAILYRQREQQELAKAEVHGLSHSNSTIGHVGEAYLGILDEKAAHLIEGTRKTLLALAIAPSPELSKSLLALFADTLTTASAHARNLLDGLKQRIQIQNLIDPIALKSVPLQQKRRHDFEIMLAEVNTALKKPETVSNNTSINLTGSQNVQIGDHNVQHNQVVVFRDLISRIEQSNATPAEKTEAKSRLKAFLEHPLVTSIAGGLAASFNESLK